MATTDQSKGALGSWTSKVESNIFFLIICFALPIHLPFDGSMIGRLFLLSNFGSIFFRVFLNIVDDVGVNEDLLIVFEFFGICVGVLGVEVVSGLDILVGIVPLRRDDGWVGSAEGEKEGIGDIGRE